jgi:hypothetical protein
LQLEETQKKILGDQEV